MNIERHFFCPHRAITLTIVCQKNVDHTFPAGFGNSNICYYLYSSKLTFFSFIFSNKTILFFIKVTHLIHDHQIHLCECFVCFQFLTMKLTKKFFEKASFFCALFSFYKRYIADTFGKQKQHSKIKTYGVDKKTRFLCSPRFCPWKSIKRFSKKRSFSLFRLFTKTISWTNFAQKAGFSAPSKTISTCKMIKTWDTRCKNPGSNLVVFRLVWKI